MAKNQNAAIPNGTNAGRYGFAAFQLNGIHAAFLQETDGIAGSIFVRSLIGPKRHITDNKRIRCTAANRLTMVDTHIHGDGDRTVESLNNHTQRVADQNHVDAGSFCKGSKRRIICRDPRHLLTILFHVVKVNDCFFLHT